MARRHEATTRATQHARTPARRHGTSALRHPGTPALDLVIDQLHRIEADRKAKAALALPDGDSLEVSNLHKIFWPTEGLTKGDLMRYYVQVSPFILPVVTDRPLVMKRYPDGVRSEAFYQHRAPDKVPPGVRIEVLPDDDVPSRPVGGTLKTLLYLTQLAAISQDPWFSRVQSLHFTDHIAFDLDPMPGTSFETVLDVARWLRDELAKVGAVGVPKTSGSDGLHVFVPMPKQTPYETGRIWAQIVATIVATRHPQVATVERSVKKTRRQGLRGLPAEHRGQDAGLRVQRAAPASLPEPPRRSPGTRWMPVSTGATSRFARCRPGWRRSATSGRRCGR